MYFDAHSDIWCDVTTRRLNGETNVFDRCHLERMRKGGVEGSIFVIWVDPPYDVDYVKRTEQIMAAAKAEIAECQSFRIVHTYDEMMQANADGKIYIFIGIEGMATMGKDLSWIDRYYDFGCRHGILTWNEANDLGAGALSGKDYGLTDVGKEAVRRMQEKGMLLDVSHLNDNGFWDLVKITQKPFVASHSNSRALCSAPRNLTDDQLRAIRDVNGVVGLNAFNLFIDDDPKNQTVQRLAEHAAHMIDVMGQPRHQGHHDRHRQPLHEGSCKLLRNSEPLCLLREDGHEQGRDGEDRTAELPACREGRHRISFQRSWRF